MAGTFHNGQDVGRDHFIYCSLAQELYPEWGKDMGLPDWLQKSPRDSSSGVGGTPVPCEMREAGFRAGLSTWLLTPPVWGAARRHGRDGYS